MWEYSFSKYGLIFSILFLLASCKNETGKKISSPGEIDFDKLPYKTLSEYGLFQGTLTDFIPSEGVIPYEPASSLFTDYAYKQRYIWIPEDTHATIPDDPDVSLDFPEHTILVKHFYYPKDFNNPEGENQKVETRLLILINGIWEAYGYMWNEEQTEAVLKNTGGNIPVEFTNLKGEKRAFDYYMPQKTQCRSCHYRDEIMMPIGSKAKQLNHDLVYSDGTSNQLEKWVSLGVLKTDKDIQSILALVNPMDEKLPIADRARSYLDANCSHCHTVHGPGSTSGLFLNLEEDNPLHLGIWKSPVAAGMGGGGYKYAIHPGHGMQSIITFRMNSVHPGVMMPELGRVTIHEEGVKLISDWIDGMESVGSGQ